MCWRAGWTGCKTSYFSYTYIYFQGTLALELLQQAPDLDAILVPVSGGGMISGIAIAAKSIKQDVKGKHYRENQI